jgi:hypothetical protein
MSDPHTLSEQDALTYLHVGVNPHELVRLRWPDMTDEQASHLLWEQTPFPMISGIHDIADAVADIPIRVRLSRVKGWRLPKHAVSVARPTRWGNPFKVGTLIGPVQDCEPITHLGQAVLLHRRWVTTALSALMVEGTAWEPIIDGKHLGPFPIEDAITALHGRDLACWCPAEQPCHSETLLEVVNA